MSSQAGNMLSQVLNMTNYAGNMSSEAEGISSQAGNMLSQGTTMTSHGWNMSCHCGSMTNHIFLPYLIHITNQIDLPWSTFGQKTCESSHRSVSENKVESLKLMYQFLDDL